MYLTQLVYVSIPVDIGTEDVRDIVAVARDFNARHDITGALLYEQDDYFLQCLEGSRFAVSSLYNRIATDRRHRDVEILSMGTVARRDFPGWSMGHIEDRVAIRAAVRRFSPTSRIVPQQLSAESALELLRHFGRS